jgi:hypothetical protein
MSTGIAKGITTKEKREREMAMKSSSIAVWVGVVLSTFTGKSASLFTENFGSLTHGTGITTSNTALTYARVGTGSGAYLNARNPGSFAGASALLLATSSSLTGLGVTNGTYAPFDVGTFSFSLRTPPSFATGNDLFFFVGSGTTFSGNSAFSGNDLTAGFMISAGQLQTRNSLNAWENFGSGLSPDTSYSISIVFNGSASPVSYGSQLLGAGKADVWLGGMLWGDDVSIRDTVSVSAFRIYCQGSASGTPFEIDNIDLSDTLPSVPEPSVLGLLTAGMFLGRRIFAGKR